MAPTRTRLEEILIIRSELNRLVEDLHQPVLDHSGSWVPPMDCSEDGEHYHITLEIPGVTLDEVSLNVQGQTFLVEGIRKPFQDSSAEEYLRMERFYGPFKRSLTLPLPFDWEGVDARLERGILRITIPKKGTGHGK